MSLLQVKEHVGIRHAHILLWDKGDPGIIKLVPMLPTSAHAAQHKHKLQPESQQSYNRPNMP